MNSEANDKENGLGKGEKVGGCVRFGQPGCVPNKLSKSKNWYVVPVCSPL